MDHEDASLVAEAHTRSNPAVHRKAIVRSASPAGVVRRLDRPGFPLTAMVLVEARDVVGVVLFGLHLVHGVLRL